MFLDDSTYAPSKWILRSPVLTPTVSHAHYQRRWMPVAVPPPFTQGQRLSVGLFYWGILRACGGSWGFLRTWGIGLRPPFEVNFVGAVLLSWSAGCLAAKSASEQNSALINHCVTRGPINRLDAIIAYPKANSPTRVAAARYPPGAGRGGFPQPDQAALEHHRP